MTTPDVVPSPFGRPAQRTWIASLCLLCVLLITLQAWSERFAMNPDGISYLDMADKLAHGDFSPLLHPYWSPLYPVLLALVLNIFSAPALEFPAAHLANWLTAIGALASFTFFLNQFLRLRAASTGVAADRMFFCRTGFAYSLFLWGVLEPTGLGAINPDLFVTALVYLSAGLFCRLTLGRSRTWTTPAILGIVLGTACLTKAAMAPLGALLLFLLWVPCFISVHQSTRLSRATPVIAMLCFAAIFGPYAFLMSRQQHHLTFGEAGRLNYAWLVQGEIPLHAGWMGQEASTGTPAHAPHLLSTDPPALEFDDTVRATYPLWYDPAYFHEGLKVKLDVRKEISAVAKSLRTLPWAAGTTLYPLLAGLCVLAGFASLRQAWSSLARSMLLIWSLAAFGTFALVTIEPRYIAPFLVLFWLMAYDAMAPRRFGSTYRGVISVIAICTFLFQLHAVGKAGAQILRSSKPPVDVVVAQELTRLGLQPGNRIATVGSGFGAYYARLARLEIVANIGWTGDDAAADASNEIRVPALTAEQLEAISNKLRAIRVDAIVSPRNCANAAWHSIGETGYCVVLLDRR